MLVISLGLGLLKMDETEATGAVKQSSYLQHPAVIISDGIGFFALATTGVYLAYALCKFRGPDGEDLFWMGSVSRDSHLMQCVYHRMFRGGWFADAPMLRDRRREEKFLSVFVNFFAAIAYWCCHTNKN